MFYFSNEIKLFENLQIYFINEDFILSITYTGLSKTLFYPTEPLNLVFHL